MFSVYKPQRPIDNGSNSGLILATLIGSFRSPSLAYGNTISRRLLIYTSYIDPNSYEIPLYHGGSYILSVQAFHKR